MKISLSTNRLAMDEIRLLAYAQYMAQTAQSDQARAMFSCFAEQERQRLKANKGSERTTHGPSERESGGRLNQR